MKKPEVCADRVDLDDVIAREDLQAVVRSVASVTKLSSGIVRMPPEGCELPSDPAVFGLWRLTDVENRFPFCEVIRSIPQLDVLCMWSDLRHAAPAFKRAEPVIYHCIPSGLIDMVAAIEVAGRHVANIYIGRARTPESTFEKHYEHVLAQLQEKGVVPPAGLQERLREAYRNLPEKTMKEFDELKPLLSVFAELLSQRANRQVALKVLGEVGEEITDEPEEKRCIERFYSRCRAILNFDSGSVFMERSRGKDVKLESSLLDWGEGQPDSCSFDIKKRSGLAPLIYKRALEARENPEMASAIFCTSRSEMDKKAPPAHKDSRDIRGIESFIGVPIETKQRVIGTLDIGSRRKNAFSPDDLYLLKAAAKYLAVALKACRNRSCLLGIVAKTDRKQLLDAVAAHLPELTNGRGCSVFLKKRAEKSEHAVLWATNELPARLVGEAFYEPDTEDGFTGWVLSKDRILNVPGGPGARLPRQLGKIDPDLKWTRKYWEEDDSSIDYQDLAFLGCPIRTEKGELIGVLRIGGRMTGSFTAEDEATAMVCANAIGSIVARAGLEKSVNEIEQRLKVFERTALAGQREILKAIFRSPHSFVMLASTFAFVVFAVSLALYYALGVEVIDPGFSWFGCFASGTYWLMGKVTGTKRRRDTRRSSSTEET